MPASHPPSYCHLIFAPKLGLTWLPMDSTLDWLLFSLEYGCVCVFRGAGQRLCVVGTPRPPPWGSNLLHWALISLLLPVGEGGQQRQRGRRGARKRLLPEREETWELGNGKAQGSPLPAHGFLSPPPPPANTWHGHKQGLCSFPLLGQTLGQGGKEQAARSRQGEGRPGDQGGAGGAALWAWQLVLQLPLLNKL